MSSWAKERVYYGMEVPAALGRLYMTLNVTPAQHQELERQFGDDWRAMADAVRFDSHHFRYDPGHTGLDCALCWPSSTPFSSGGSPTPEGGVGS